MALAERSLTKEALAKTTDWNLTWVGEIQLFPGHHLLKSCIRSVDMSDWDTSSVSKCPDAEKMSGVSVTFIQSSYRFGVENSGNLTLSFKK